jgi:hypothetical protein
VLPQEVSALEERPGGQQEGLQASAQAALPSQPGLTALGVQAQPELPSQPGLTALVVQAQPELLLQPGLTALVVLAQAALPWQPGLTALVVLAQPELPWPPEQAGSGGLAEPEASDAVLPQQEVPADAAVRLQDGLDAQARQEVRRGAGQEPPDVELQPVVPHAAPPGAQGAVHHRADRVADLGDAQGEHRHLEALRAAGPSAGLLGRGRLVLVDRPEPV